MVTLSDILNTVGFFFVTGLSISLLYGIVYAVITKSGKGDIILTILYWSSVFIFLIGIGVFTTNYLYALGVLLPLLALLLGLLVVFFSKNLQSIRHQEIYLDKQERTLWAQADELIQSINNSLTHATITNEQKASLRAQAADIQLNILKSGQILHRLRETNKLIYRQTNQLNVELQNMERKRTQAIYDSLVVLRSIPVALLRVESARDARSVDAIIKTLADTNQRVRDIADAHDELHQSR